MSAFVIGDIHGSFDKLMSVIKNAEINFDKDTVIFLGDYIDRGMHSNRVIQFLINLKTDNPKRDIICLMGNHEEMLLRYLFENDNLYIHPRNGGFNTLQSYGMIQTHKIVKEAEIPNSHIDFITSLKRFHITDHFIFVHAGLDPKKNLKNQDWSDNLWIRDEWIDSEVDFGKRVIFGHTIFLNKPYVDAFKIGIDTGSYRPDGMITALRLDDMKFFHSYRS